jgi:thiosulfate/3-mercaptopyruvate sulfurtransferase
MNASQISVFVDPEWLREHLDEVVVADVRWYVDGRSGADAYRSGHLPGAVFVDLDTVLADPGSTGAGRHPLPDPERLAADLGALGIGDRDVVVAYDDDGGVIAARLVWMLRATGHAAAVLDGGVRAWGEPLDSGEPAHDPKTFTARPWPPGLIASIDDVAATSELLLDARDRSRYRGEFEPADARAGHIPGARSLPARENTDAGGRLLPVSALRERLTELGVEADTPVVSSCGSGVTACHNLLVLEHAGLGRGRLYPGSWSQWSADPARPAATGDD